MTQEILRIPQMRPWLVTASQAQAPAPHRAPHHGLVTSMGRASA
ncbi:hypothetical protein [Acetobacter nitrogenifigens]|nr:hypothetical protein [Acetobacter nitrogenifigens]